jgi:stage V sporulation protein G
MKIVRMNPLKNNSAGKTVAFFDMQTNDGIVIKGFRIVNGSNGLFVSSPDEKGKDGKYYESVVLPKEIKDELQKIALEKYNKE